MTVKHPAPHITSNGPQKEPAPLWVGERGNISGSREFSALMKAKKYPEALRFVAQQESFGAEAFDLCLMPEEAQHGEGFWSAVAEIFRVPLFIDSRDPTYMEMALNYVDGKAYLNSLQLRMGAATLKKLAKLAGQRQASVVVSLLGEGGKLTESLEDKIQVASHMYQLLVLEAALDPAQLIWDPLVLPSTTHEGSRAVVLEALEKLKVHFPGTKTMVALSNISYGLKGQIEKRIQLNGNFYEACVQKEVDVVILNAKQMNKYLGRAS